MINYNKLFLPDYKEIKVLKKLSHEEVKEIDKKYELSFFNYLKKKLKNIIFFFFKKYRFD